MVRRLQQIPPIRVWEVYPLRVRFVVVRKGRHHPLRIRPNARQAWEFVFHKAHVRRSVDATRDRI